MGRMFGTDGVRGLANAELSPELAFALGRAGAAHLRASALEAHPTVVVGKDPRRSGDMLEAALIAGICSVGVDVLRLGVVPTPTVAWLTRKLGAAAGVMISASHNPSPDNGIKFFSSTGFKLPDEVEDAIEAAVQDPTALPRPTGAGVGRVREGVAEVQGYLDHVAALLPAQGLAGLKVVVDAGHGAAHALGPALLKRLGAEVVALGVQPDGDNINREGGSTHLGALQEAVVAARAHAGIAWDGDADRCLAVDERGRPVDGDAIMYLVTQHLVQAGRLPDASIVATVMSNMGFEQAVQAAGGRFVRAKVGDRYVLEQMQALGVKVGGEQSGHLIFLDDNTTGDGLITAVRLLEALRASQQPLSELNASLVRYPQQLRNLRVAGLKGWADKPAVQGAIEAAEGQLGAEGRVLVRASGTEPVLRVMVEAKHQAALDATMGPLCDALVAALGHEVALA